MILILVAIGLLQLSAAANIIVTAVPRQGLSDLVAVDYNVTAINNETVAGCQIYNPYAQNVDVQYYASRTFESVSESQGTFVFKKDDANPISIKCWTNSFEYASQDIVVTPLRMITGLDLILLILGMLICIIMFFITPDKGKEVIWGIGAGATFLIFSQLSTAALYDQVPEYSMMAWVFRAGFGIVFVFMLFRLLQEDLNSLLNGPGKKVGETSEE